MGRKELEELMANYQWEVPDLARAAEVREATVYNWLRGGHLHGPARILLREWLNRSRMGLPPLTPEQPETVLQPAS